MANTAWYLYNHRLSLARALRNSGHEVVMVSPSDEHAERLKGDGFNWFEIPIDRKGTNPITDIITLARILGTYRRVRPDLVHHFTIKPVVYGSLAALILRLPAVVNSITGLGYLFTGQHGSLGRKRMFAKPLIRVALTAGRNHRVVFQHEADLDKYVGQRLVDPRNARIIPGSGVDPDRFKPYPEPPEPVVMLMAGRMLWDKGVSDLVEAGTILQRRGVPARIVLVGAPDPGNPSSIPETQLQEWERAKKAEWWGYQDDITRALKECHIVVLPSYTEGVPRVLLEAAAMGKPIVASDIPGCRQVVIDGQNGFLVPVGNADSLADALEQLAVHAETRRRMGQKSRQIVVDRFTNEIINRLTLELYRELLGSPTSRIP